jgi:hypothetical protein
MAVLLETRSDVEVNSVIQFLHAKGTNTSEIHSFSLSMERMLCQRNRFVFGVMNSKMGM